MITKWKWGEEDGAGKRERPRLETASCHEVGSLQSFSREAGRLYIQNQSIRYDTDATIPFPHPSNMRQPNNRLAFPRETLLLAHLCRTAILAFYGVDVSSAVWRSWHFKPCSSTNSERMKLSCGPPKARPPRTVPVHIPHKGSIRLRALLLFLILLVSPCPCLPLPFPALALAVTFSRARPLSRLPPPSVYEYRTLRRSAPSHHSPVASICLPDDLAALFVTPTCTTLMYFHVFSSTRRRFVFHVLYHIQLLSLSAVSPSACLVAAKLLKSEPPNALPTSPSSLKLDRLGCELDHPSYSRGLRLDLLLDNHPMT